MTRIRNTPPDPEHWIEAVIAFLRDHLPRSFDDDDDFDHRFISAYQIGCEGLAALGQAEETWRGARLLDAPCLPGILPRWDDICVTVLKLANQKDLLSCRLADGSERPETAAWFGRRGEPPPPNLRPAHGLGWAQAAPDLLPVLDRLGLIRGDRWTARAETLFWRVQPEEWALDVAGDGRFLAAVDHAAASVPDDIRAEMGEAGDDQRR